MSDSMEFPYTMASAIQKALPLDNPIPRESVIASEDASAPYPTKRNPGTRRYIEEHISLDVLKVYDIIDIRTDGLDQISNKRPFVCFHLSNGKGFPSLLDLLLNDKNNLECKIENGESAAPGMTQKKWNIQILIEDLPECGDQREAKTRALLAQKTAKLIEYWLQEHVRRTADIFNPHGLGTKLSLQDLCLIGLVPMSDADGKYMCVLGSSRQKAAAIPQQNIVNGPPTAGLSAGSFMSARETNGKTLEINSAPSGSNSSTSPCIPSNLPATSLGHAFPRQWPSRPLHYVPPSGHIVNNIGPIAAPTGTHGDHASFPRAPAIQEQRVPYYRRQLDIGRTYSAFNAMPDATHERNDSTSTAWSRSGSSFDSADISHSMQAEEVHWNGVGHANVPDNVYFEEPDQLILPNHSQGHSYPEYSSAYWSNSMHCDSSDVHLSESEPNNQYR
ncbi:hypothetical protein PHLGIDRAFT_181405 [Phlebiopsis gigantea 11061_1 CR5-6]|uniref:Uncharacterized protein n=1 Tax=Phlebiopsis gigantea (strain 11061_1 CR5-6) TaxID=745531 RepID=A0A0C3RUN1_PHLG1|nr:hypothetical protein PHLGIDRAFT_181405 [Phlebiopsis gigantea 11061_1 CR5-6]